jgi:putative flippase GtrA
MTASTNTDPGSLVQRVRRCLSVSVVTTVISVSTLVLATAVFGVEAWIANVIATSLATVPSFHLNRRWTWGRTDASDPLREVLPFWIMAFCGLALSTVTVGMADSWAARTQLSAPIHLGAILAGHLGGFGLLWVAQFVILDRVLFAHPSSAGTAPDGEQAAQELPVFEPFVLAEANHDQTGRGDDEQPLVAGTRGHHQVRRNARDRGVVFELRPGVAPPAQSVA